MNDLNARLLTAHAQDDKPNLVTLYAQAATTTQDTNARAFYLTHAYIFALETNHQDTSILHAQLVGMNRDA